MRRGGLGRQSSRARRGDFAGKEGKSRSGKEARRLLSDGGSAVVHGGGTAMPAVHGGGAAGEHRAASQRGGQGWRCGEEAQGAARRPVALVRQGAARRPVAAALQGTSTWFTAVRRSQPAARGP
uniref:Uncharacterized protein n=1 Tax=Oryza barthii TaxID=65489 RepID=A0A0D3FKU4_9ORYZ